MDYWKYIWRKARYNHPLRLVVDGLWKMGVQVRPFCVFQEGLSDASIHELETGLEGHEIGFLGVQDMKAISEIPLRNISLEQLLQRLKEGKKCLGMKCRGELIAFVWCDFDECNFEGFRFDLSEDEVYLFDMYTLAPYRGRGIAPYLRYQCYRELDILGKRKLFSISDYFNTPSIKFKLKLNARIIELALFVDLFGKRRLTRSIKKYSALG
jgi:GNAT superfamily N-acetyltransferase